MSTNDQDGPSFDYVVRLQLRPASDFIKRGQATEDQPEEPADEYIARCADAALKHCIAYSITDGTPGRRQQRLFGVTEFHPGGTPAKVVVKEAFQVIAQTILDRETAANRTPAEFAADNLVTRGCDTCGTSIDGYAGDHCEHCENANDGAAAAGEGTQDE